MSLPFSTSKVLIGSPQTIKKVIGNGLIPFLAADGNLYLVDVVGNVTAFSNYAGLGAILYDEPFVTTASQTQFPLIPSSILNSCNKTQLFMEGSLLNVGGGSDEYVENFGDGFVTTNFTPGVDIRMRLIAYFV